MRLFVFVSLLSLYCGSDAGTLRYWRQVEGGIENEAGVFKPYQPETGTLIYNERGEYRHDVVGNLGKVTFAKQQNALFMLRGNEVTFFADRLPRDNNWMDHYSEEGSLFAAQTIPTWRKLGPDQYRLEDRTVVKMSDTSATRLHDGKVLGRYEFSSRRVSGIPAESKYFVGTALIAHGKVLEFRPEEPPAEEVTVTWFKPDTLIYDLRVGTGVRWTYDELVKAAKGRPMTPALLLELSKRRDQVFENNAKKPAPRPQSATAGISPTLITFGVVFGTGLIVLFGIEFWKKKKK